MKKDTQKIILLVEDKAIIAMSQGQSLEGYSYKVIQAHTGKQAIEIVKTNHDIDLILMDIDLGSGIDGTETAEIILKDRDIPIVFLSSHTEPEIVEKTEKITSYGYVVKNTGITVLDASIKMAFKLFEAHMKEKAIEEALRKNETRLKEAQQIAHLGSWESDLKSGESVWSEELYNIMGIEHGTPINTEIIYRIVHPDDLELFMQAINEAIEKKETNAQLQYRIIRPDGEVRWVDSRGRLIYDTHGDAIKFIGTELDITERKLAEKTL